MAFSWGRDPATDRHSYQESRNNIYGVTANDDRDEGMDGWMDG